MWRPPQRIRYEATAGRVPSTAEAAASRLFSPVAVGPLQLEQRTWVPAMVPWRATEEGYVTEEVIDWYERFARGRPGAIVLEATGIRDVPSGPLLRIGHDRFLPGLQRLVEAVRKASDGRTRLFVQLIDFLAVRRRPEAKKFLERFLVITDRHRAALGEPKLAEADVRARLVAMREDELKTVLAPDEWEVLQFGYREHVNDMHLPHIRNLPQVLPGLFAEAALRAEAAGLDGIELHYAHAYTMSSFFSRTNKRADGYGGSLENRARLPLEVFAEIRRRVSKKFAVGLRFLADECIAAAATSTMQAILPSLLPAPASISSRYRAAENSTTPNNRRLATRFIRIPGRSGYECMPQFISDERGRSGATSSRRRRSARPCAMPVVRFRLSAPAASIISKWPRIIWPRGMRHRRRRAAIARRSRLVPQNPARNR